MTRKLNVQTPGEAPAIDTQDANTDQGVTDQQNADLASGTGQPTAGAVDLEAMMARLAELEAKNAELEEQNADLAEAAAKKDKEATERLQADEKALDEGARMISRADRAKFLTMHSSQVDAKKLLAPVLCKDGWVAPDQSDQPPRR